MVEYDEETAHHRDTEDTEMAPTTEKYDKYPGLVRNQAPGSMESEDDKCPLLDEMERHAATLGFLNGDLSHLSKRWARHVPGLD